MWTFRRRALRLFSEYFKTLETCVLRNVGNSELVDMEPHRVVGVVIRHCLVSSVCELIRGLEEFSAERRTVLGETFRTFLSLLP